ncbi:MAG: hypothetical protein RR161_01765 [Bacilli bacterium]
MFDNFGLKWFTTIPGLLISAGVLLLLVALILFIASSGKKNKKVKSEDELEKMTTIPEVTPTEVVTNEIVMPEAVTLDTPTVVIDEPVIEPTIQPVIEPVVIETPVVNLQEEVVKEEPIETPISIYGGVNPANVDVKVEEHKPIYGGYNPLEATQTIPTINNSVKPAYNEVVMDMPVSTPIIPNVEEVVEDKLPELVINNPEEKKEEVEVLDF